MKKICPFGIRKWCCDPIFSGNVTGKNVGLKLVSDLSQQLTRVPSSEFILSSYREQQMFQFFLVLSPLNYFLLQTNEIRKEVLSEVVGWLLKRCPLVHVDNRAE